MEVVEAIAASFRDREGVKLLDLAPDPDFNRTVVTAIGRARPLLDSLVEMASEAVKQIDMNHQTGSHPRIGAQDTIPVFPLRGTTLDDCDEFVRILGGEINRRLDLPVYFSGDSAATPKRSDLAFLRTGQYESLAESMRDPERRPDLGDPCPHPTAGAIILSTGTRPLVACNVLLSTTDLALAKSIAQMVRGPSGGFSTIRAVGVTFEDRNCVAVSMNMFDYEATPLHRVVELVRSEAARHDVRVIGTELVGVVPLASLLPVVDHYLQLYGFRRSQILEEHLGGLVELGGSAAVAAPVQSL
jgi:glutamate formiminotransferase/formiminotetrahydrofolate cyclodeaminase